MNKDISFWAVPAGELSARKDVVDRVLSGPQQIIISRKENAGLRKTRSCLLKNKPLRGRQLTRGEKLILIPDDCKNLEAYVIDVVTGIVREQQPTSTIKVTLDSWMAGSHQPEDIFCGGLLA